MEILNDTFTFSISGGKLVVEGEVRVHVDWDVQIVRAAPQGINPRVLLLKIQVKEPTGIRSHAIMARKITYEEAVGATPFDQVTITFEGKSFTLKPQ
jgi:hypothetical protein